MTGGRISEPPVGSGSQLKPEPTRLERRAAFTNQAVIRRDTIQADLKRHYEPDDD
jgi:hypothetical protein